MSRSKPLPPNQALSPHGPICPRCGIEAGFAAGRCGACGTALYALYSSAIPHPPDPEGAYNPSSGRSSGAGALLILIVVVVGAIILVSRSQIFAALYQMVPWLRGMTLEVPVICAIAAAVVIVVWAGKFLDLR
jgi:hypothetical protein